MKTDIPELPAVDSVQLDLFNEDSEESKPNKELAYAIVESFKAFAEARDISTELISTKDKSGNISVLYEKIEVLRIRCTNKNIGIHIPFSALKYFESSGHEESSPLVNNWYRVSYPVDIIDDRAYYAMFCVLLDTLKTVSKSNIGCCHLYRQCSDFKRCIALEAMPNSTYAHEVKHGCKYRLNLLQGKIFYGVNALPDLDDGEREVLKAYRYSNEEGKSLIRDLLSKINTQELRRQMEELSEHGLMVDTNGVNGQT